MTYIPRRDYRFEYVFEAMKHVEERDCKDCIFAVPGEYPMCLPISSMFLTEEPVEEIDDLGDDGLRCTKKVLKTDVKERQ